MPGKFTAWLQHGWLRFRTLFRRHASAQQLDSEMQFHLDQQVAENIAAGMSAAEAREAALRLFGNRTLLQDQTRDTWGWIWLEQVARNFRYAARSLRRTPGFSIASILVIAFGIGATTALFTVVRSVLLNPLPFKDPASLLRLYEYNAGNSLSHNFSAAGMFEEWKKQNRSFSDMALIQDGDVYALSGSGSELPEEIDGDLCSWNFFSMLGVKPALGRLFSASDDQLSSNATVVLTWGLFQRRFGGDPAILNQTIQLEQKSYTVIGVLPAWFAYPDQKVQLWTPVHHETSAGEMQSYYSHDFESIGRLKPGFSADAATADLTVITRRIHDQHLDQPFISVGANSAPLLEDVVGQVKTPLYVLLAATGCVLLIACLNVASLLIARSAARRRDLAIRTALGGSRPRLLGEHLTESLIISALGGALGLLFASAAIQWFVSTRQDMSRVEVIRMDPMTFAVAGALIFLCSIFAGATSSISLKGGQILSALQESSRSSSPNQARVRLRKWLLSVEVGLTVVLLIVAGLLLKSYQRLRSADLGCITNNVLTLRLSLPDWKYTQAWQSTNFYNALLERVRALPGIQAAGLVRVVPGDGYGGDNGFTIAEYPPLPQGRGQYALSRWADRDYFASLGIPFRRGETFDTNQKPGNSNQVIISESFVRKFFGSDDPIGKHLATMGQHLYEIVGVVADTRYGIALAPVPTMYFPLSAAVFVDSTLVVRSSGDVTRQALPIQKIVQQLDSGLAVYNILTMDQLIGRSTLNESFDATLLLIFAVLSLVLAAVGLFGVLSYIVTQRTIEIGIRMALGAPRESVLRLMLIDGLRPAAVGLIFGYAVALELTRVIQDLLYGVEPLDAGVFVAVAFVLLGVAAAACYVPAWRASRLDPIQALRSE